MRFHPFELGQTGAQRGPQLLLAASVLVSACARATIPPLAVSFPTDTVRSHLVADGVIQRHIRSPKGPWAIEVLDVDLSRGYCAIAVKGAPGATGRTKTSVLLTDLAKTRDVVGGVNADFFTLAGFQGVPTGALISSSTVIVGPGPQPVVAVDPRGMIRLGRIQSTVTVSLAGAQELNATWNRPNSDGLAVYDDKWGGQLDTATGVIEVSVSGNAVGVVDTALAGSKIPMNGIVIVVGRNAPQAMRSLIGKLKSGERVGVTRTLSPFHPIEAVGGRPMLVRDSAIVADVETEGQASFRARNPRTAAGVGNDGKRLILAVIDGRQTPYSDGTTLRETAEIMLALGARGAINLDGGGSSTLVYRDSTKAMRIANKPSDPTGERPVGDALAIVKGCSR